MAGLQRRQDSGGSAADWVARVKDENQKHNVKEPHQFRWHELEWEADWLPVRQLAKDVADRKPSEGSCMLISETMLQLTKCVLTHLQSNRQPIILQGDITWKISKEQWAVAVIGFSIKHCLRKTGFPSSGFCCCALGWGPKESEATWTCLFITFLEYLRRRCHFQLHNLAGVLLDGTPGGHQALRSILPQVARFKDLYHVQTAVSNLPLDTCGQRRYTDYLEGEIQLPAMHRFFSVFSG